MDTVTAPQFRRPRNARRTISGSVARLNAPNVTTETQKTGSSETTRVKLRPTGRKFQDRDVITFVDFPGRPGWNGKEGFWNGKAYVLVPTSTTPTKKRAPKCAPRRTVLPAEECADILLFAQQHTGEKIRRFILERNIYAWQVPGLQERLNELLAKEQQEGFERNRVEWKRLTKERAALRKGWSPEVAAVMENLSGPMMAGQQRR